MRQDVSKLRFRQNNGSVLILSQALLEDTASQIVCHPKHDLKDSGAKLLIQNMCLVGGSAKPGCLEDPQGIGSQFPHTSYGSTQCGVSS